MREKWIRFNPNTGKLQIQYIEDSVLFSVDTDKKEIAENLGKPTLRRLLASPKDKKGFHKLDRRGGH